MKKLLVILFLSLLWSNISFADTRYNLIQINCYEKTGYFELRKFQSWNLNMYKILEDKNLISLFGDIGEYKSISKKCELPKRKFVKKDTAILIDIYPYCRSPYKGVAYEGSEKRCNEVDAKFDIWHVDENGKKLFIEKGKFWLTEEPGTKRISNIEYIAKDQYFTVHFKETISSSTNKSKEQTYYMRDYKYPKTNESLYKMMN